MKPAVFNILIYYQLIDDSIDLSILFYWIKVIHNYTVRIDLNQPIMYMIQHAND